MLLRACLKTLGFFLTSPREEQERLREFTTTDLGNRILNPHEYTQSVVIWTLIDSRFCNRSANDYLTTLNGATRVIRETLTPYHGEYPLRGDGSYLRVHKVSYFSRDYPGISATLNACRISSDHFGRRSSEGDRGRS